MIHLKTYELFSINEDIEYYQFDDLDIAQQNILIELKELIDECPDLLHSKNIKDYPNKPIGGNNPYWECKYCGQSDPYVSIKGHFKNCEWENFYHKFDRLKSQLPINVLDNISDYLNELS